MYVLLIMSFILTAGFLSWFSLKADYHGKITDLDGEKFVLVPLEIDPEAEYSFPAIRYGKRTEITGNGSRLQDLAEGVEVKVWSSGKIEERWAEKIKLLTE